MIVAKTRERVDGEHCIVEFEMEMEMEMKIVTYNINGLRPRISQFGSLLKFLSSLDADIICLQETKLSRQELATDLMIADGYESFFSCTRTTGQGRVGYSGVATFCRVKSAFLSNEVTLPLAAEEGFTGLLENSRGFGSKTNERPVMAEGLEEYAKDDLLKIDSEGRCIITDHGHFGTIGNWHGTDTGTYKVLFNLYGPCVTSDDTERIQFKLTFFEILQKRWELLLHQGRRIIVVGDLNIAPAAIDRCDATPEFENNEFRKWLRSMLVEGGGSFFDTFRSNHPERREAYTCWAQHNGSEQFNFGSRIDHILISISCLHEGDHLQDHNFLKCHVKECDIMSEFQRWKPGITPRWKGGRSIKLEGSDHAPVYAKLIGLPHVQQHSTPLISSRYAPIVRGVQQTIASVFMKRQASNQPDTNKATFIFSDDCTDTDAISRGIENENIEVASRASAKKKAKKNLYSQLSLKSFFQRSSKPGCTVENSETSTSNGDQHVRQSELKMSASSQDQDDQVYDISENEKNSVALLEWQRIQQLMQSSIPLCKGHGEACVVRVVKKAGPSNGQRFYVCCRPEGPASNPDTNCGFFKWATSKSKQK